MSRIGYARVNRQNKIKAVDCTITDTTVGTTPAGVQTFPLYLLNGLIPGNRSYNRVGNMVTGKNVRIRGSWAPAQASTFPGPNIRTAVVFDTSPPTGGLQPTYEKIFQGFKYNSDPIVNVNVSPNPSGVAKFIILADWKEQLGFVSNANGVSYSTSPAQFTLDQFINFYNYRKKNSFESVYVTNDTSGEAKGISTGSLYLVLASSGVPGSLVANFTTRYTYLDV